MYVFGRLKPGVTLAQLGPALNARYRAVVNDVEAPLQKGSSEKTLARFKAKGACERDLGHIECAAHKRTVDFCPLNFQGIGSLPGSAVIDLDRLNTTLTAVNALFVAEFSRPSFSESRRLTIAEALLLDL